jgi:hypothetical protein
MTSRAPGRKRKTPLKPINLFAVAPKKSTNANTEAPPVPIVPPIFRNGGTPTGLRSPKDSTQIMINGNPVQIDDLIQDRINGDNEDRIKPLTPPLVPPSAINGRSPEIRQYNLSPNNYIDDNIKIIETPKKEEKREESIVPPKVSIPSIPVMKIPAIPRAPRISELDKNLLPESSEIERPILNNIPKFNISNIPILPITPPKDSRPLNPANIIEDEDASPHKELETFNEQRNSELYEEKKKELKNSNEQRNSELYEEKKKELKNSNEQRNSELYEEKKKELKNSNENIPLVNELNTNINQEENMKIGKSQITKNSNIKSMFPTFNKPKINEFLNNKHSPESSVDSDNEIISAISPVNIPYPVFNNNIRAASPIQTIGATSPGLNVKPIFTETGKSITPTKPSSVKASTPPPLFRSPKRKDLQNNNTDTPEKPSKVHNKQVDEEDLSDEELKLLLQEYMKFQNKQSGNDATPTAPERGVYRENPIYLPPENHNRVSNRPNYSRVTKQQETFLRQEFKVKFGILRSTYPQWEVVEPDDSLTLDQIHDLYDHYLKQIMISRESGNYKTYMVIFLMVIEVIGVKFLKLNMSGYTMSQLRIMNRYDTLFIELGEKYLVSSGSNWPVEARIVMMMLFNAVIFLVVRYLCSWMGMDGIADTLQNMIDNMLNGPSMVTNNSGPVGSSNPIPDPLGSSASAPSSGAESSNPIDKIADMFGSFMSKNSGGITEKIAELGTMFTNKTQNTNTVNKKKQEDVNKTKEKEKPKTGKKINKKKLFDD